MALWGNADCPRVSGGHFPGALPLPLEVVHSMVALALRLLCFPLGGSAAPYRAEPTR